MPCPPRFRGYISRGLGGCKRRLWGKSRELVIFRDGVAVVSERQAMQTRLEIRGVEVLKGYLDPKAQEAMVGDIRGVAAAAPLFSPETRFGRKMSVAMTSAGKYGWYTDRSGYRYERRHPSGREWPPIPDSVLAVWRDLVSAERLPDCCLVNFYRDGAKMGLHQDRDEADFSWPVLSVSLGDTARFRIGSVERGGSTEAVWLESGDVCLMGGPARLVHHGIDKVRFGSSSLLSDGGRINLTLRVVD